MISLPAATKMFQFTAFPSVWLLIGHTVTWVFQAGFPHSDIHGSLTVCVSPWLFAADRVLHRLLAPRHPPFALCSLFFLFERILLLLQLSIGFCSYKRAFANRQQLFVLLLRKSSGTHAIARGLPFDFLVLCSVFKVRMTRRAPRK